MSEALVGCLFAFAFGTVVWMISRTGRKTYPQNNHFFQISPQGPYNELTKRVSIALNEGKEKYGKEGPFGFYRGDVSTWRAVWDGFVKNIARDERGNVIIFVCTHGSRKLNGNFRDTLGYKNLRVTPDQFWNGSKNSETFPGMRALIELSGFRSVEIVFAQCYSAHFADSLRKSIDLPNVTCVGLSYGKTYSSHRSAAGETLGKSYWHKEMSKYLDQTRGEGKFWVPNPAVHVNTSFDDEEEGDLPVGWVDDSVVDW
jgi:hypothetical protein